MNKKNLLKIILDICMVTVLALMYSKRVISMEFHEIGGLVLLGVFVIHILLNYKWVITITKKLFLKSIPVKTKVGYLLNLLLLISFILIGVSGIFISKVVFHLTGNGSFNWKTIHYTSSAVALILTGIHIGLHFQFINSMFKKMLPLPQKAWRFLGIILTIIIFSYGCYSITATDFAKWLSMPFTSQQMRGNGPNAKHFGEESFHDEIQNPDKDSYTASNSKVTGEGIRNREGLGKPGGIKQSISFINVFHTFMNFFSIAFVFAVITTVIELLLKRKKIKIN